MAWLRTMHPPSSEAPKDNKTWRFPSSLQMIQYSPKPRDHLLLASSGSEGSPCGQLSTAKHHTAAKGILPCYVWRYSKQKFFLLVFLDPKKPNGHLISPHLRFPLWKRKINRSQQWAAGLSSPWTWPPTRWLHSTEVLFKHIRAIRKVQLNTFLAPSC